MFTRKDLKSIASLMSESDYYTSLYLDVDPTSKPRDSWLTRFKSMSRDTLNGLDTATKAAVKTDLENIEGYLSDKPEGLKKGLAIISSKNTGYWRVYNTAVKFNDKLAIEHYPYIKPLATMLDTYARYLIVAIGSKRARLLVSSLGEISEVSLIDHRETETGSTRDVGRGDTVRSTGSAHQVKKILFKEASAEIQRILADENIERILLAGSEANRGQFIDALPRFYAESVVGQFTAEVAASLSDIQERALPVMREVEYNFERKALDELFGNGHSVLGLSDVLTALQQGNVHKIYVMSDMTMPGKFCKQCGALTPPQEEPCPYCQGDMKHVNYMLDLALQKAIEQGARIDMLDEAPRLVEAGGIGAKLRY